MQGVEGSVLEIAGSVDVEVQLEEEPVEWRLWVAKKSIMPLIIGMNILDDTIINLKERVWEVNGVRIPLKTEIQQLQWGNTATVLALHKQTIPPFSRIQMLGKVVGAKKRSEKRKSRTVEFIGGGGRKAKTISAITKTVMMPHKKERIERIVFWVENNSNKEIEIQRGDTMGEVESVDTIQKVIREERHPYERAHTKINPESINFASKASKKYLNLSTRKEKEKVETIYRNEREEEKIETSKLSEREKTREEASETQHEPTRGVTP